MAANMFDEGYTDGPERPEPPTPEICPCAGIRNFKCPARVKQKLIKDRCTGSDNYTRCSNFSSWYWFKCAQQKATEMSPPDADGDHGDFCDW